MTDPSTHPLSDLQQQVLAEAHTWLGTPWHHEGGVKGSGVDCAMLLVRVFASVGAIPAIDPRPYPMDHMLHSGEERFLGWLERFADPIAQGEAPRPGDVVIYRVGRCYSHGAIVTQWPNIIHAFRDERQVVATPFNAGRLASRPFKILRLRALEQT
jgi:cell wall-associated NlpC family hydrolase